MERIILVTGGNRRGVENYTAKGLACSGSYLASPFWIDVLSPSACLLGRISKAFKFDPWVMRACLARCRQPSCEDFGDYLFIQTSFLEPSRRNLFIQQDIKIILSRKCLITLHKSQTPFHCSLSRPQVAELTHAGSLLLKLFEHSTAKLMRSFCSEQKSVILPAPKYHAPTTNPLWWRLRNFRAALLRNANSLHSIAAVGARFFGPGDRDIFEAIRAMIYLLYDATNRLLSRMDYPVAVPSQRGIRENLAKTTKHSQLL